MNELSGQDGSSGAGRRASIERLLAIGMEPEAVARIEKRWVPGPAAKLRVWIYTPVGAAHGLLPGLVYLHGGGFGLGSLETHDGICRALANASACRVIAIGHRLGIEAPLEAALLDASAATRWIAGQAGRFGIDPRALAVGGDDTGAALAIAVAQTLAAERDPPLALQLLLCPALEFHAGISAPPARLEGLPPACIHTAESDPLRGQGAAYAERLERAGGRVIYRCHPGALERRVLAEDIRALL